MNQMNQMKDKQYSDDYYMGLALKEAREAYTKGEVPIGAVIVIDGEIIASAHNLRETLFDATAHAEIIAIREACRKLKKWRLTNAVIYVTIEPCPMCAGAIVMARVARLVYGSSDYKAGAVESIFNVTQNPALNHQVMVTAGVRSDECSEIMRDFFRQRRASRNV